MPLPRELVEAHVKRMNAARPPEQHVRIEAYEPPGRFELSFPDREMPPGECIDQDLSAIQWALHEEDKIDTNLLGGRRDEATARYHILYEVIEWD